VTEILALARRREKHILAERNGGNGEAGINNGEAGISEGSGDK
jgi:hypothetical protein